MALKSLGGGVAEVKRLYVRGAFRRLGLGEQLMQAAIGAARGAGYGTVRLDTLPFMAPAIALYHRLGFLRIPRYNDNPDPDALFFELSFKPFRTVD